MVVTIFLLTIDNVHRRANYYNYSDYFFGKLHCTWMCKYQNVLATDVSLHCSPLNAVYIVILLCMQVHIIVQTSHKLKNA